jgi:hypothetical protein
MAQVAAQWDGRLQAIKRLAEAAARAAVEAAATAARTVTVGGIRLPAKRGEPDAAADWSFSVLERGIQSGQKRAVSGYESASVPRLDPIIGSDSLEHSDD